MLKYLFSPLGKTFKFEGTAPRSEFFIFLIASLIGSSLLFVALIILQTVQYRYVSMPILTMDMVLLLTLASQFPMVALSVRRLRDAGIAPTAALWLFVPPIGQLVLFCLAFRKTDFAVTLPNGQWIMNSVFKKLRNDPAFLASAGYDDNVVAQASSKQGTKFAAFALGAGVALAGASAVAGGGSRSTAPSKALRESRAILTGPARDKLNKNNSITAYRAGYVRNGKHVKGHFRKYGW